MDAILTWEGGLFIGQSMGEPSQENEADKAQ